ncbi:hypothetical protein [Streptomyces broussonetiae]|uniref:Uncharacterized protein n=1 Tax=Streptomyces broussonetiae TaxID=2686304 RepID=A0ABV5EDI3_9ACTN
MSPACGRCAALPRRPAPARPGCGRGSGGRTLTADLIHTACENTAAVPAGPLPDDVRRGQSEIGGVVRTGDDERERGNRRAAPLRTDGSRGCWHAVEELLRTGGLTDDGSADHFVDDLIVAGVGEGTDGRESPGAPYSVDLR